MMINQNREKDLSANKSISFFAIFLQVIIFCLSFFFLLEKQPNMIAKNWFNDWNIYIFSV